MFDLTAKVTAESAEDLADGLEALVRDLRRYPEVLQGFGQLTLGRVNPVVYSYLIQGESTPEETVYVLKDEDDSVQSLTVAEFAATFLQGYPLSREAIDRLLAALSEEDDMDETETRAWVDRWLAEDRMEGAINE